MKRSPFFRVFFVMFIVLFLTIGCSNDNNNSPSDKNSLENNNSLHGDGEAELPPMTEEEITLTYASWTPNALNEYLAESFMKKYPNITVNLVTFDDGDWNDNILNLASIGELPDVFWYNGNLDIAIQNGWLGDLTEYYENDPENEKVLTTVQNDGYIGGDIKLADETQ